MSTCTLAVSPLPAPNKKSYQNQLEIPPLSLTFDQAAGLIIKSDYTTESLQILTNDFDSDLTKLESGEICDKTLIEGFFALFNKTFFFGLIRKNHCQLRFIPVTYPDWVANFKRGSGRFNAYTNHYRYRSIISRITLFERDLMDYRARSLAHLGTLAHEIIHSFFHIYTCCCEDRCKVLWKEKNGLTGHGVLWHRCALMIENALRKALGPGIHLSRAVVMGKELAWRNASTSTMPLAELGLSVLEVERKIRRFRRSDRRRIEEFSESDRVDESSDTLC